MTTSNWIWSSEKETKNSTSYFRREFDLKKTPTALELRISAHNHLNFYVNGNRVTGYVSPAPTVLPENVYYLSYEFTGSQLSQMISSPKVCLAAEVQYLGDSGTNYVNAHPALWVEATFRYDDGSTETVVSDKSWSCWDKTPYKNETPSVDRRNTNAQIDYDARVLPDALSWTKLGFSMSEEWKNAVEAHSETKEWKLRRQLIPEGAVHERITPTTIGKQEIGWQVFDAGRIVTGWVRFRLSAPAGTRICVRYSEYKTKENVVAHCVGSTNQKSETYCDYYTFSGQGVEEFVFDFDYKAFRYFEITGLPEMITADALTVEWASTDMTQTASFSSSDDTLNRIFQACINTQINNVIGMPVDCPHREQSQYIADSQLQYALISLAFQEYPELCYKTLHDFAASQRETGRFSFTAPTEGYASKLSIPEWDLRYSEILYQYYLLTGDAESTALFYEAACKNINYYLKFLDGGLLPDDPAAWNISDHPMVKHVPDDPGVGVKLGAGNMLLYGSMDKLSKLADALGKAEETKAWREKADDLKDNINNTLLDRSTGLYYGHSDTTKTNTGITALAINVGVSPDYYRAKQLQAISRLTAEDTSIVLTYERFRAIAQYGNSLQKEFLYDKIMAVWGNMVDKGFQTVWEGFKDQSSHTHAWSGYPAYFMLTAFAGIRVPTEENGIPSVIPYLPGEVTEISGSTRFLSGEELTVTLKEENGYTLKVNTPVETLIAVPRLHGKGTVIRERENLLFANGNGIDADSIKYVKNDGDYVYFTVSGGREYQFLSTSAEIANGEVSITVEEVAGGQILIGTEALSLPHSATATAGETLTLKAVADAGYAFIGWSGTHGSSNATVTVTADSDVHLIPVFEKREGKVEAPQKPSAEINPSPTAKVETSEKPQLSDGSVNIPLILTVLLIPLALVCGGIFLFRKKK